MTLRLGDHDGSVPSLRQQLCRLFTSLPRSESDMFDADMSAAVSSLQADYTLNVDGVFGPATRRALLSALSDLDNAVPDFDRMSPLATGTVQLALDCLRRRIHETPPGSNRGPEVDRFLSWHGRTSYVNYEKNDAAPGGYRGAPWCGAFVAWCATSAAKQLGVPLKLATVNDLMGCRKWRVAASRLGLTLESPEPGCVGLVTRDGGLKHVVLVTRVSGDTFWSVEGNSSGDRVRALQRPTSRLGACLRLG